MGDTMERSKREIVDMLKQQIDDGRRAKLFDGVIRATMIHHGGWAVAAVTQAFAELAEEAVRDEG